MTLTDGVAVVASRQRTLVREPDPALDWLCCMGLAEFDAEGDWKLTELGERAIRRATKMRGGPTASCPGLLP